MKRILTKLWPFALAVATLLLNQPAGATQPPVLKARAWALLDARSGQLLAQHQAEQRLEPASLTKMMSAAIVFKALKSRQLAPEQMLTPSARATAMPGASMHLVTGTPVSVEDLLQGMLVVSANDATLALAEGLAGSEQDFVARMNQEALRLGLANTHFQTATGHSTPGHFSSAHDLARLAAALVREHPDYYPLFGRREHSHRGIRQENRNRLLWLDATVDGIKTGQTEAAGWCLAASAVRGQRRLIAIVLGAPSEAARFEESLRLLNYGFQAFDTVRLHRAHQPIKALPVWRGTATQVRVGFQEDLTLSLPREHATAIQQQLLYRENIQAPLHVGDSVGSLRLSLDGEALGDFPIQALEEVPVTGWAGRLWDSIRLYLKNF